MTTVLCDACRIVGKLFTCFRCHGRFCVACIVRVRLTPKIRRAYCYRCEADSRVWTQ